VRVRPTSRRPIASALSRRKCYRINLQHSSLTNSHPDRFPAGSRQAEEATASFQEVNNAYYVLSDPARRREYDATRAAGSGAGGASWSSFFGGNAQNARQQADAQFGDLFEEMMQDENLGAGDAPRERTGSFYGMLGGASGAALGFIVANLPGALAGAVAGNRLGAIRDTKGKPVYQVFQEMPHSEKARLLSALLAKVMAQLS
jgi:diphthamide biosynthesis protein 4